jgi:dTDP-4-dehydrorhamnose 3,5-epimerase
MPLTAIPTGIPDVKQIDVAVHSDQRGFFLESYNRRELAALGITEEFVQDNISRSSIGVLRGLHYQLRQPQGKLVRVILGQILDVAVDLRRSSPSFGRWTSTVLSAENKRALWIPKGFAHGYIVQSDVSEILYKTTDYYAPEHERCILWDDPDLRIEWGIPRHQQPVLSAKDAGAAKFKEAELCD